MSFHFRRYIRLGDDGSVAGSGWRAEWQRGQGTTFGYGRWRLTAFLSLLDNLWFVWRTG